MSENNQLPKRWGTSEFMGAILVVCPCYNENITLVILAHETKHHRIVLLEGEGTAYDDI